MDSEASAPDANGRVASVMLGEQPNEDTELRWQSAKSEPFLPPGNRSEDGLIAGHIKLPRVEPVAKYFCTLLERARNPAHLLHLGPLELRNEARTLNVLDHVVEGLVMLAN